MGLYRRTLSIALRYDAVVVWTINGAIVTTELYLFIELGDCNVNPTGTVSVSHRSAARIAMIGQVPLWRDDFRWPG